EDAAFACVSNTCVSDEAYAGAFGGIYRMVMLSDPSLGISIRRYDQQAISALECGIQCFRTIEIAKTNVYSPFFEVLRLLRIAYADGNIAGRQLLQQNLHDF